MELKNKYDQSDVQNVLSEFNQLTSVYQEHFNRISYCNYQYQEIDTRNGNVFNLGQDILCKQEEISEMIRSLDRARFLASKINQYLHETFNHSINHEIDKLMPTNNGFSAKNAQ